MRVSTDKCKLESFVENELENDRQLIQAMLEHVKDVNRNNTFQQHDPYTAEQYFQRIEEYTVNELDIMKCWFVYGTSYDAGDCLWGIFETESLARQYIEKQLQLPENSSMTVESDFVIFSFAQIHEIVL
jgi:hypothetical protein